MATFRSWVTFCPLSVPIQTLWVLLPFPESNPIETLLNPVLAEGPIAVDLSAAFAEAPKAIELKDAATALDPTARQLVPTAED